MVEPLKTVIYFTNNACKSEYELAATKSSIYVRIAYKKLWIICSQIYLLYRTTLRWTTVLNRGVHPP